MFLKRLLRRLRGALGVATLWAAAWFVGGLVLLTLSGAANRLPWDLLLSMSARLGTVGFFTGGAFSGLLTFGYRNRSLSDISTARVALGGAVVAALLSPGMAIMAGIFGGVTAATSIKLAKAAVDPLDPGEPSQLIGTSDEGCYLADPPEPS